jgi:hypothetical protein
MKKIDITIHVCVDSKHVLNVLIKLITAPNAEIKIIICIKVFKGFKEIII